MSRRVARLPLERRLVGGAPLSGLRTASVEVAPLRWVDRRRHVALEQDALPVSLVVDVGDGREEGSGVWMSGPFEELVGARNLDDLPEVHHGDPVTDAAYDS